jgi:trigger factor
MRVDVQDLGPAKKSMSVEVDVEDVARETEAVLRGYRQRVRVPGFRPGKAPLSLIQARYGKEVQDDVRDRLVTRFFQKAAQQNGLRPVGEPLLDDVVYEEGRPLSFKTTFEVLPQIEPRSYKSVEVRRPSARISEADIEAALEELRQARAAFVTEEGREASSGDVVIVDLEGAPAAAGAASFRRERIPIEVGARTNLPAFNERLVGARAGAELSFAVDYPQDFAGGDLAGKRVEYRLTVHEVKRRQPPALDDEFAKDLGEFDNLDALRARIRKDLEASRARAADQAVRQAVLDHLLLENPIVLPDALVEHEIRRRLEEVVRNMILQGLDPQKLDIDWAQLRSRQEEPARKAVHARLLLEAVARVEGIAVDSRDVEDRVRRDAERTGQAADKLRATLKPKAALEAFKNQLLREKSLDYLTSVANIQYAD